VVSLFLVFALALTSLLLWQRLTRATDGDGPSDMEAIPLVGGPAAPEATGYIIVSPDGLRGALVVDGLAPLPEDQEYQLWLIRDGQPTSGALLTIDDDGYGGTRVWVDDSLFTFQNAWVTIEPAGGNLAPSGGRVLEGDLIRE
jgi:hypothetical protein